MTAASTDMDELKTLIHLILAEGVLMMFILLWLAWQVRAFGARLGAVEKKLEAIEEKLEAIELQMEHMNEILDMVVAEQLPSLFHFWHPSTRNSPAVAKGRPNGQRDITAEHYECS